MIMFLCTCTVYQNNVAILCDGSLLGVQELFELLEKISLEPSSSEVKHPIRVSATLVTLRLALKLKVS